VRAAALAGALVVAGCLTGCLTGCASHDDAVAGVEAASMATVRTARCVDWNEMSATEHERLLAGMRAFFGGVVDQPGMRGQVLPAAKARKVLDGFCSQPFAGQFTLYRLYGDAAAFTPADVKAAVD
jgi:hypothetical protein